MPPAASAAVFTRSPFLACSQRSSPPYACARRLLRSRREPSKLSATSAARQTSCFCFEIGFDDGLDDLVDAGRTMIWLLRALAAIVVIFLIFVLILKFWPT